MKVIFMGTSNFAVPALSALINSKFQLVAIYTAPPKPGGRGMDLLYSPIHKLAIENKLNVLTPISLKNQEEFHKLQSFKADIGIIASYGLILPKGVLESFKYGCINIHPSALPRWRGAAPIQRTIMAGDKETELCIMQMDEGLDTGDVILRHKLKIEDNTTARELEALMGEIGAEKLLKVLSSINNNEQLTKEKQSSIGITYAHKLQKNEEKIDWDKDAVEILGLIRAFSPKPGAYFLYNQEIIKIITAELLDESKNSYNTKVAPGTVIDDPLVIACRNGFIRPTLLQRQGRKMIYTEAFLRGFPINIGSVLSS